MTASDKIKYLGIFIDKHLRWNHQIDFIVKKLSCMLGRFKFYRDIQLQKNFKSS